MGLPNRSPRFKRWFACAPVSLVYPQPRSAAYVGLSPALSPTAALTTKPPSVQSPFAQCWRYLHWGDVPRLLGRHYSSVLAHTDSCADPMWLSPTSAIASFEKSLQVATSPCCHRDLPDVISANPSSDAWSLATAGPQSAWSGKAMARTGLRMMPTFPLPPLKFRTAGFPRYGFKAGLSDAAFPYNWFAIVLRALGGHRDSLLCVRDDALVSTSVRADLPLYPRGPRSGPGYAVPVHPHLIGPIRPTRGHIPTSPPRGLYEMPSLCIFAYA
jgi:hypothetical protein